jgi:glyoxylase-like metal-dependent hydrolase (beta-lactamase superfamily II)
MTEEILPGFSVIEVPLPQSPLKSINSYVIVGPERNLVIDTGMRRPECEEAIRSGLDDLEVDLEKTDFFITHMHADHMGLVSELAGEGSTVYFNRPDGRILTGWVDNFNGSLDALMCAARKAGFSGQEVRDALERHPGFKYSPTEYPPFEFLEDGGRIEVGGYRFDVVATPGHTPGHLCLYEPEHKVLISGDHVLGDITPNITVWQKDDDSLGDYLESLEKVAKLDVDLVLPGHRRAFDDLSGRIDELQRHHRQRLEEVFQILQIETCTPYQVASRMTWDIVAESWADFPVVQKWFATSEAVSHLRYLQRRGLIAESESEGVVRYSPDSKAIDR